MPPAGKRERNSKADPSPRPPENKPFLIALRADYIQIPHMAVLLLLSIIVIPILLARSLWTIHNTLVPLKHTVAERKANVMAFQQSALSLLNDLAGVIGRFESYESPLLNRYLGAMEQGVKSGMSGEKLISIVQAFAPPSTQSAGMYNDKIGEMTQLHREFNLRLQAYHAAVAALNTQKDLFPANLFNDSFFNITQAVYLEVDQNQIFPPSLIATHIDQVRQLTAPTRSTRGGR